MKKNVLVKFRICTTYQLYLATLTLFSGHGQHAYTSQHMSSTWLANAYTCCVCTMYQLQRAQAAEQTCHQVRMQCIRCVTMLTTTEAESVRSPDGDRSPHCPRTQRPGLLEQLTSARRRQPQRQQAEAQGSRRHVTPARKVSRRGARPKAASH